MFIDSERASPGYTLYSLSWEAIWWLAGVQIWRGRYGSCVGVWPLEVNVHVWTCSTQYSVDAIDVHWIHIEKFDYWSSLNLDLVWTDLLSTEHEAWSKNNLLISLSDSSLLKDVRNLFGTITQTHHVLVMFWSCARIITINTTPKWTWNTMVTMATVHKC